MLRMFYIAYIRSKLEYGCEVFSMASSKELDKLYRLQNSAIRLIIGARKTTPILSLEVESHLSPLKLRFSYRSSKYYLKLMYRPRNDKTCDILQVRHYVKEDVCYVPNSIFRSRVEYLLRNYNIEDIKRINGHAMNILPPYYEIEKYIAVDPSLVSDALILEKYNQYLQIYTDGSKVQHPEISTASGMYIATQQLAVCWKLHAEHTVVAAELFAIKQALIYVHEHLAQTNTRIVIITDSLTSCNIIKAYNSSYGIISNDIKKLLYELNTKRTVKIQWVRSHIGIQGNEIADKTAKLGHKNNKTELYHLEQEELQNILKNRYMAFWNENWKKEVTAQQKGFFLLDIQGDVKYNSWVCMDNRRSEVVLARLRTGHAATRAYLNRFSLSDSNQCNSCGAEETIRHILIACNKYQHERNMLLMKISNYNIPNFSVRSLLGGEGKTTDKQSIVKATMNYIKNIGKMDEL